MPQNSAMKDRLLERKSIILRVKRIGRKLSRSVLVPYLNFRKKLTQGNNNSTFRKVNPFSGSYCRRINLNSTVDDRVEFFLLRCHKIKCLAHLPLIDSAVNVPMVEIRHFLNSFLAQNRHLFP